MIVELRKWTDDLNQANTSYLNNIAQLEQNNSGLHEDNIRLKQRIKDLIEDREWLKEKIIQFETGLSDC